MFKFNKENEKKIVLKSREGFLKFKTLEHYNRRAKKLKINKKARRRGKKNRLFFLTMHEALRASKKIRV